MAFVKSGIVTEVLCSILSDYGKFQNRIKVLKSGHGVLH